MYINLLALRYVGFYFPAMQVKSPSSPSSGFEPPAAKLPSAEFLPYQNTDLVGEK